MPHVTGDDGTPSGYVPPVPFGVWGDSGSPGPFGGGGNGVIGSSSLYSGVAGITLADSDRAAGVFGGGPRVGIAGGVTGSTTSPGGRVGVYGTGSNGADLGGVGVHGQGDTNDGVIGESTSASGVVGLSTTAAGILGVSTRNVGVFGISNSTGITGWGGAIAGEFIGDVDVTGKVTKAGGGFTIDHPLDPGNRYLRHSFVESSEMKNLYDGIATCDDNGEVTVTVPEWFESLNRNFRYQLTPIGAPAPNLFISDELHDHHFSLSGGTPGLRVSWQVTGVRDDAWARANPLVVEEEKSSDDRGRYRHPELHGQAPDVSVAAARHPEIEAHLARTHPNSADPLRDRTINGR